MPVWREHLTKDKMSDFKKLRRDLKKDARSESKGLVEDFSRFIASVRSLDSTVEKYM